MDNHLFGVYSTVSTVVELLQRRAKYQPDREAYTFLLDGETYERTITYKILDQEARRIGAHLQNCGFNRECALLLYEPGIEFIKTFFGCLYADVIVIPAYPPRLNRPIDRLQNIILNSHAKILFANSRILSDIEQRLNHYEIPFNFYLLDVDKDTDNSLDGWYSPAIDSDAPAIIQYTSGSTNKPKGVMLSHSNLLNNAAAINSHFGLTPDDQGVIWLPPYHDMGLIGGIIQPLYSGFPVTLMSPTAFLEQPLRWLQAISHYQATISGGPNFAYELCVQKISTQMRAALNLSSWAIAFNGAEPVRPDTLERFINTFVSHGFRRNAFSLCYGLAEATVMVAGNKRTDASISKYFSQAALQKNQVVELSSSNEKAHHLASCGQAVLGHKVIIVDPYTLSECADDEVGEIWVSGPSVAKGYWQDPKKTFATFQANLRTNVNERFLRTGDLGFLWNGQLFITGRLKDLIIIRGRNYYPQDIELTVQKSHQALQPNCGAAFSIDVNGEERLVVCQEVKRSYRKSNLNEVFQAIREKIAEEYELQVYAILLLKPGSIPKTSSGKIQRNVCRDNFLQKNLNIVNCQVLSPNKEGTIQNDIDSTRDLFFKLKSTKERHQFLESYFKAKLSQVVKISPSFLNSHSSLLVFGVDSLTAIELQNFIQASLEINVPMEYLLSGVSINELIDDLLNQLELRDTEAVSEIHPGDVWLQRKSQPLPLRPIPIVGEIPLSFNQERLWILDQMVADNSVFNIPIGIRIMGKLKLDLLERSLNEVIKRHESLRTVFATIQGKPAQVITPALELKIPVKDLSSSPEAERELEARRLAVMEAQSLFDINRGPLIRALLLCLNEKEYIGVFTAHHLVADIWSMDLLVREVAIFYQSFLDEIPSSLQKLAFQYRDFAYWQKQSFQIGKLEEKLAFWRRKLANASPVLEVGTRQSKIRAQCFHASSKCLMISEDLTETLREISHREGTTLFTLLLTVFKALFVLYTKKTDIIVGSPIAGRDQSDLENLIGFFAYPLVLRTNMSGDPTFREMITRVRHVTLEAYAHRDIPFAKVIEIMQSPGRSKTFPLQIIFAFMDRSIGNINLPDLSVRPITIGKQSIDFDLFLTIFKNENGLQGLFEYNSDLFTSEFIQGLLDSFSFLLEFVSQDLDKRLSDFLLNLKYSSKSRP